MKLFILGLGILLVVVFYTYQEKIRENYINEEATVKAEMEFVDEEQDIADINLDHSIDVLDIVQLITTIINTEHMPYFSLLDFNPNSDYYNQSIGPETFSNEVSCYYFGKQG